MPPLAFPPRTTLPRILVVEPDDDIRRLLTTALVAEGYHVVDTTTATGANRALRSLHPTVVVTELLLGGDVANGLAFLRGLRDHDPGLPAVVCTGVPLTRARRAELAEVTSSPLLVPKPFEHAELLGAVMAAHRRYVEAAVPARGGAGTTSQAGRAVVG